MIPVRYLEELKAAPVEEVDFVATFIEVSLREMSCARSGCVVLMRIRCSKANILPWAVDQPCILGLSKRN